MSHRKLTLTLFIVYIVGMTAVMIWQGIGIAPDRYAFVLLLGSLLVKRTRRFLLDWVPFLFILISYDFLRGFADNLNNRVHFFELIHFDKALFGELPTTHLQKLLYTPGVVHWYDVAFTIIYFLHFALPMAFGFLLWLYSKPRFREFTLGLLLLSYAAWITYIIYPAAPPWMAADKGYVQVDKVMFQTFGLFPEKISLPTVYHKFNPNPVAAIPSMHAGYPIFVLLFAFTIFKKKALFFLPYVLIVWFAIIYLGEHYVIDVLLGALYGVFFFIVAKKLSAHVKFLHHSETHTGSKAQLAELKNEEGDTFRWLKKKIDRF
ncbi:phosphatase PAP2 family protein [Candidatus Daviesbacteria bacterium]|nr:phosphatase PAP2 family protein [Candidatus Daviesbacteria bacterium]